MKKKYVPIVIFVYARPEHTKKMFESLIKNYHIKESDVYIFSDYQKNEKSKEKVNQVRDYINNKLDKNNFKKLTIYESNKNNGLANSVISGVTEIINKYGKVIVLEDDLILSKNFIDYMNDALNYYEEQKKIWSISGYNLPIVFPNDYQKDIYFSYRGCSWGWATWKDRWEKVDWKVDDYNQFKNNILKRKKFNRGGFDLSQMLDAQMNKRCDSWAIRWCYQQSKENSYTVYPVKSLVKNIGLDGSGTHSGTTNAYTVEISENKIKFSNEIVLNKKIIKKFKNMFNYGMKQKIIEALSIIGLYELLHKMRQKNEK